MGVEIVAGQARLIGAARRSTVDRRRRLDASLEATTILLCTGSRPAVPADRRAGGSRLPHQRDVFELERCPGELVMIGGGPIAIEMAQALQPAGDRRPCCRRGRAILPRDEPELVGMLARQLGDEGVDLRLNVETERVAWSRPGPVVVGTGGGGRQRWPPTRAARRRRAPARTSRGSGWTSVGVEAGAAGVEVDERMRTSVPSIYAAGDVAGRFLFTHSAGYEAVRARPRRLLPGQGQGRRDFVPWCTFTDPELAHAGLTVAEAEKRYGDDVEVVHRWSLSHNDRARADGATGAWCIVVQRAQGHGWSGPTSWPRRPAR